jgi:hypothetical protein
MAIFCVLVLKLLDLPFYTRVMIAMSNEKQDSRTALRLPSQMRKKIDPLIAEGKFKTLSQVMREALREYLENRK